MSDRKILGLSELNSQGRQAIASQAFSGAENLLCLPPKQMGVKLGGQGWYGLSSAACFICACKSTMVSAQYSIE